MASTLVRPDEFPEPLSAVGTVSSSSWSSTIAEKYGAQAESNTQLDYRKITWKLDKRLIGTLGMIIMIEFLDRVGLGFARIVGIDLELQLDLGYRFSLVILVANISTTLVQVPMMFMGHLGYPPYLLAISCLGWTATLLGIAFAKRWTDLLPCRIFAGAAGGVISQVIHVLIQTWYPRYEMGRRFAWLNILVWISKAIGGATAFGIAKMAGVAGLTGWRWIYIWSGILTAIAAILAYARILGYADTRRWKGQFGSFLSPAERQTVLNRLEEDRGDSKREVVTFRSTVECGMDFKIWLFGLIAMANNSIMTSLAIFSPMIMHHDFGFEAAKAQALYAPPYFFTAVMLVIVSELSDRRRHRGVIIIACIVCSITGLILIGFTTPVAVRYLGLFFANAGLGATWPLLTAFLANNIRGFKKRSFATAVQIAFAGIGGIIGALIFRSQDAPRYLPGLIASIAMGVAVIAVVGLLDLHFFLENRKQQKIGKVLEGLAGFRYTY